METKKLLNELIENEFEKLEKDGVKIRLKRKTTNAINYTVICAIIFLLTVIGGAFPLALIDLIIYFVLMYNNNNTNVIAKLAKKFPDKPILDIIKGEIK